MSAGRTCVGVVVTVLERKVVDDAAHLPAICVVRRCLPRCGRGCLGGGIDDLAEVGGVDQPEAAAGKETGERDEQLLEQCRPGEKARARGGACGVAPCSDAGVCWPSQGFLLMS